MDERFRHLSEIIDAKWPAQIEWLRELARFPSTRGNEGPCQDWLADEYGKRGWSVDKFTIADVDIEGLPGASAVFEVDYSKATQVVAALKAREPSGRSLILQGHIDVVPTGPRELWAHDPFEPQIADGFMSGRGTTDMKVGVAEMVFALDAIAESGLKLDGDVFVETVSEEECTGNGALATLARGYLADAVLVPEALDNKLIRAQLGSVWFRLRIYGMPVHVLQAQAGSNAILSMYGYIDALQRLTQRINDEEGRRHPWFGHIENPVKFNVGKIRGGDWVGSVPAWCEIDCRLSTLPGQALADVRSMVSDTIAGHTPASNHVPEPVLEWIGFQAEGYVLEPGSEAEAVLAGAHKAVLGTELETFSLTATSDVRQYGLYYGIPALCYGGRGSGAHSSTERTDLESMRETTKIIALFICQWCGLKPA